MKYNYPIDTSPESLAFWESTHYSNECKRIACFSKTEEEYKHNLRRWAKPKGMLANARTGKKLKAYNTYKHLVNNPSMTGVYFSGLTDDWWLYT